jgi:hypothetical protein
MKRVVVKLIALSVFSFSGTANAAGWYTGTINRIQTSEGKTVTLFVDNASNNECGSKALKMNDTNSAGANWIYSSLLAYQAQKRKVQFYISGCSGSLGVFTKIEDLD